VPGTLLLVGVACSAADLSAVDRYVRTEFERVDVPGAAVAVWQDDGIAYAKGFGVRSAATGEPMTADTPVDLASVSKSLTAVAVKELTRQGRIDPAARVTEYLPELGGAFSGIRIRDLMKHTSGLTRRDDFLVPCCGRPGDYDLLTAAGRLAAAKPARKPGAEFAYANSNYVLLAAVVQRVSGQAFPVFMRESVFRPRRMLRTTLDPVEAREWGLAESHERCWRNGVDGAVAFLGWYGSSLVKSTARDMAGYLGWVLGGGGHGWSEPYDGGWFVRRWREAPGNPIVLEHGGNTAGGNTAAIVVPAWRIGAVVLLNAGVNRAAEIARGVLACAAGLGPPRRVTPAKRADCNQNERAARRVR
jgi:CubicO group peptidase (beta-lactamase class C family)